MSVGASGRIVLEIDPLIKRQLYAHLATEGITLKGWFLKNVHNYMDKKTNNSITVNLEKYENEAK